MAHIPNSKPSHETVDCTFTIPNRALKKIKVRRVGRPKLGIVNHPGSLVKGFLLVGPEFGPCLDLCLQVPRCIYYIALQSGRPRRLPLVHYPSANAYHRRRLSSLERDPGSVIPDVQSVRHFDPVTSIDTSIG